jgi:single-strand DNA-binding protein
VASDDGFGDKKKTSFFDCTIFGKFAESIDSHLVKGQQVIVFGRMEQRTWQTQDGQKRSAWGVVVDQLRMCGKSGNGQQSQSPREQAEEFPDFDTPDITDPFADQ